jgi:hypothetical protein
MVDTDPVVIRSIAVHGEVVDRDPIVPRAIEHRCEEIMIEGKCQQRYNYLVYTFEREGIRLVARMYLHTPTEVSLFPERQATEDGALGEEIEVPDLRRDVASYLRRRYRHLKLLTREGYRDL